MNWLLIQDLLQEGECEYIDFKEMYQSDLNKHIHDILCLLNSDSENDRYLLFGVNDAGVVVGIDKDEFREKWNDEEIQDWLMNLKFNRKPTIKFKEIKYDGKTLGILFVKNRHDKPFYLTTSVDKVIPYRIYTRNRSTNVPYNGSADEVSIENMWRERFGLNLSPLEKFERFIDEHHDWYKNANEEIIHRKFPEFCIRPKEPLRRFEVQNVYRQKINLYSPSEGDYFQDYDIYYSNVLINSACILNIDDFRTIMPDFDFIIENEKIKEIYINKHSLNYKVWCLLLALGRESFLKFRTSYIQLEDKIVLYSES